MILEFFTFFVAAPIALAMAIYALALSIRCRGQHSKPHRERFEERSYACCTPGREMEITVEQDRHAMSIAIEQERHHNEMQRIHERDWQESIDRYNRQITQQPARQPQIPQPTRHNVPRLPDSGYVEISDDGIEWFVVEDNEHSEVSR